MTTYIGPLTDAMLDTMIKQIKKTKTKEKIMKSIIDPLLCDIMTRYYPYLITITIILSIIVILLISILSIIILDRNIK
jgi:hypothetical protein